MRISDLSSDVCSSDLIRGARQRMPVAKTKPRLTLRVDIEEWPLKAPFRITGHTFVALDIVVVTLACESAIGRGEAAGVSYRNDTVATMAPQNVSGRPRSEERRVGEGGGRRWNS